MHRFWHIMELVLMVVDLLQEDDIYNPIVNIILLDRSLKLAKALWEPCMAIQWRNIRTPRGILSFVPSEDFVDGDFLLESRWTLFRIRARWVRNMLIDLPFLESPVAMAALEQWASHRSFDLLFPNLTVLPITVNINIPPWWTDLLLHSCITTLEIDVEWTSAMLDPKYRAAMKIWVVSVLQLLPLQTPALSSLSCKHDAFGDLDVQRHMVTVIAQLPKLEELDGDLES